MKFRDALIVGVWFFLGSACLAQDTKATKAFPTNEEIQLVVTQSERAFEQYRQSVEFEAELPTTKKNESALDNDKQIVKMSAELIDGLKKRPDVFNGLGGLLLLTTLDDASRNAALCASSGMSDIGSELLRPKLDSTLGYKILSIAQKCSDVSLNLYTVSESVNALFVRTMEAQQDLNDKAVQMLNECSTAMKNATKK